MADASCAVCGGDLPSGFPGATVTCTCGARATHPPVPSRATRPSIGAERPRAASDARAAGPTAGGPYRAAGAVAPTSLEMRCPYCGHTCSSALRVCPSCDVRFDSVRCASCYTLQPPGTFVCGRCGRALELEPVLDVTDAPCPRCVTPLEAAGGAGEWVDARLHECPRCGGMFVPRDALADILCRAEQSGSFAPAPERAAVVALDQVTYIPCPLCRSSMNRMNFGKVSGVIVDVCRAHGTWFDGGELTRVVAFAASGGLVRTRAREEQEQKDRAELARAAFVPPPQAVALERFRDRERLEEWRTFLGALFSW
ncbi:MAG: zf-TFIIB domain-containing protein [Labilithrix sp.]|nr:zf-TFIIB domain-containing protein [Labilithrix sp.]